MRHALYTFMGQVVAGALLILLVGCASTEPSRFYLLTPIPAGSEAQRSVTGPCISLGIGPVTLPEYVNRPQIATRATQNELLFAQFDRWAEPLSDTFSRVFAEDLSRMICTRAVYRFPWKASTQLDYRVEAEVMRMDGSIGKEAVLEVWWTLSGGAEKKGLASRQSRFTEPVNGQGYEALVQAHSRLLGSFSREIAAEIGKFTKEGPFQK